MENATLTPEQQAGLREIIGNGPSVWKAEQRVKNAAKRHGVKMADLQAEQSRVDALREKEAAALEQAIAAARAASAERLARIAHGLPRLQAEADAAAAELTEAQAELEAARNG